MGSPNNNIDHILESQDLKEATANEAFDRLDNLISGVLALALTDADHTLSTSADGESDYFYLRCSGALTANRNLIVTRKHLFIVENGTTGSHSLVVKTSAGTGITVANGAKHLLFCDGTNVLDLLTLP